MKRLGFLALILFFVTTLPDAAHAEYSMINNAAPDLAPFLSQGVRAGAFVFKPELTLGMEYNDNVYATKNNTESDWIASVKPRIRAISLWSRHEIKLDAGLDSMEYLDNSGEDHTNAHVLAGGRLDVVRGTYIEAQGGYEKLHEERGSPDAQNAWDEPASYDRLSASGTINRQSGRFALTAEGEVLNYRFDRVGLVGGGSENLDYRNRTEYTTRARVAYAQLPGVAPFIECRYDRRQYEEENEAQRNSEGYRIGAGTEIYMGGITQGEIFGGYLHQNYEDREDFNSAWYGGSLSWEATRLTSVKATVERLIRETTQAGASGILSTEARLLVQHELLRNLIIGAGFAYIDDDYKGLDLTDKYYQAGPRVNYLWNRYLSAGLKYDFTQKNSSRYESLREYETNRVIITVTGSF